MSAVDARCSTVSGQVMRWHAGTLGVAERDVYEQHLLFCPPCLAQNDKARLALAALTDPAATTGTAPDDVVAGLESRWPAS